jgi:hypothetical protein
MLTRLPPQPDSRINELLTDRWKPAGANPRTIPSSSIPGSGKITSLRAYADRAGRERVLRYCAQPAISLERPREFDSERLLCASVKAERRRVLTAIPRSSCSSRV